MKLRDILNGIEITELHADMDMEITGVDSDSRKAGPGRMFVAVVGFESDGHKFIESAVKAGAVCILCQRPPESDVPYVLTPNTRRGLAAASANMLGRPADKMKIIGVTGTNGKTTTTNLVKTIIEKCLGAKVGLIGTNGNMIGNTELHTERTTPESNELQELFAKMYDAGCEYVVMEVSSHALFLDRVYGVTYEAAVFTNLTEDHLDFHPTMEDYGKAKAILFTICRKGAVNIDDEYAHLMLDAAKSPVLKYSVLNESAELHAENVELHDDSVSFTAVYGGERCEAHLAIPGKFSVYNALSAISAAIMLGIGLKSAVSALAQCRGVMGRAEVVPTGRDFTIIIDYAHTPDALDNIISTVRGIARGRVVTLFGCGGDRDSRKRPIMGSIAAEKSDFVIVTSDNPRTEEPGAIINDILQGMQDTKTPYVVIENRREAIGWAIKNAQPRDIIILAGKGHETYQILGREKVHFDEREVVAEYLAE